MHLALHRAALRLAFLAGAWVWLGLSAWAADSSKKDYLFFSPEDLPGLRSRASNTDAAPLIKRLEEVLALPADTTWKQAHQAAGSALLAKLRPDKSVPQIDLVPLLHACLGPSSSATELPDLCANASALYGLAIAFDLGKESLPQPEREKIARLLLAKSRELATRAVSGERGGAPDLEAATALAASALAALSATSSIPDNSVAPAHARACSNGISQILSKLGSSGWPRESLPSLRRALSHGLGGFILAWSRIDKNDSLGIKYGRPWAALYATLLIPPSPGKQGRPETVFFGPLSATPAQEPAASWEAGQAFGGDSLLLSCISDAATRAALLWSIRQCFGAEADSSFDIQKGSDSLFAFLGPLLGELPLNPAKTIPRVWKDERAGIYLMRNQWEGPKDCVTAFHANTRPHPYLPSFADAGSFRLQALGGHWAVRRGKDSADLSSSGREKENAIIIPGTHGWLGGQVTRARVQSDGSASITVNLDAVHTVAPPTEKGPRVVNTTDIGIRAMRCFAVDYSGRCGAPVLLVIMDKIQNGPSRRWLMHTAEKGVKLRPNGFELRSASGATLRATIISPAKPRISVTEGRWTDSIAVDGETNFLIIMTIQEAGQPQPKLESRGRDLESLVSVGAAQVRFDGQELAIH